MAKKIENLFVVQDSDLRNFCSQFKQYDVENGRVDDMCDIQFITLKKGETTDINGNLIGFRPNENDIYFLYRDGKKNCWHILSNSVYVTSVDSKRFKKIWKKAQNKKYIYPIDLKGTNLTNLVCKDRKFHDKRDLDKNREKKKEKKQKSVINFVNYQNNTIVMKNEDDSITRDDDGLIHVSKFKNLIVIRGEDASVFEKLVKSYRYDPDKEKIEDVCSIDFVMLNNGNLGLNYGTINGFRSNSQDMNDRFCILYDEYVTQKYYNTVLPESFHVAFVTNEQLDRIKKLAKEKNERKEINERIEHYVEFYYSHPRFFVNGRINTNVIKC